MTSYIKERYIDDERSSYLAFEYMTYLNKEKFKILELTEGFIIYKFQGDACIISDAYVKKQYRKTKASRKIFNELRKIATKNDKCNVLISFSEFYGKNHEDGKGAMKSVGFVKVSEDNEKEIYMRGNF
jgi:uncharacterized Fe-S center protein